MRRIKDFNWILSGLLAAVCFLALTFVLRADFIWGMPLSAAVFVGGLFLFKPSRRVTCDSGAPKAPEKTFDGSEHIMRLRELAAGIQDPQIRGHIDRMTAATGKIFEFIGRNPDNMPKISTFMGYYLPTAIKLLDSYRELTAQGQNSTKITESIVKIAGVTGTMADAFEKQLDDLYGDKTLDIDTDIQVLKTMLQGNPFMTGGTEGDK